MYPGCCSAERSDLILVKLVHALSSDMVGYGNNPVLEGKYFRAFLSNKVIRHWYVVRPHSFQINQLFFYFR